MVKQQRQQNDLIKMGAENGATAESGPDRTSQRPFQFDSTFIAPATSISQGMVVWISMDQPVPLFTFYLGRVSRRGGVGLFRGLACSQNPFQHSQPPIGCHSRKMESHLWSD